MNGNPQPGPSMPQLGLGPGPAPRGQKLTRAEAERRLLDIPMPVLKISMDHLNLQLRHRALVVGDARRPSQNLEEVKGHAMQVMREYAARGVDIPAWVPAILEGDPIRVMRLLHLSLSRGFGLRGTWNQLFASAGMDVESDPEPEPQLTEGPPEPTSDPE